MDCPRTLKESVLKFYTKLKVKYCDNTGVSFFFCFHGGVYSDDLDRDIV